MDKRTKWYTGKMVMILLSGLAAAMAAIAKEIVSKILNGNGKSSGSSQEGDSPPNSSSDTE